VLPTDTGIAPPRRRAEARIRIAAKCGATIVAEALPDDAADEVEWVREAIDRLAAAGASGALFVFLREPPDPRLADVLRAVTIARRLQPNVVATPTAPRVASPGRAARARRHTRDVPHAAWGDGGGAPMQAPASGAACGARSCG